MYVEITQNLNKKVTLSTKTKPLLFYKNIQINKQYLNIVTVLPLLTCLITKKDLVIAKDIRNKTLNLNGLNYHIRFLL